MERIVEIFSPCWDIANMIWDKIAPKITAQAHVSYFDIFIVHLCITIVLVPRFSVDASPRQNVIIQIFYIAAIKF